jgi:hypothetical protein
MSTPDSPKTFISYSWSSPEHVEWVIELAEDLVQNGVDIILDQWDLREGNEMYAFMERMVTDSGIDKVIIVCDETYAQKADAREGGVGTETQIVSKDLYDSAHSENPQKKFVAVVTEKDEDGKAYLPTYMRNRLYIDLSTDDKRLDNFEQLLRWLYDQPLHKKPERGQPPRYLFEDNGPSLGTNSRSKRAKKLLREGESAATGALRDYFDTFAENLDVFDIEPEGDRPSPEEVMKVIDDFLPYRDEAVEVFITLARYWPGEDAQKALHSFFESLLPYTLGDHPRNPRDTSADHFAFVVYELFVYATATLLNEERFDAVDYLLSKGYYLSKSEAGHQYDPGLRSFWYFRPYLRSIEDDQKHNRISKTSDLVADRAKRSDVTMQDIMQAELVLYLRSAVDLLNSEEETGLLIWHPYSLLRARGQRDPFKLFAHATKESFDDLGAVLKLRNDEDLESLIGQLAEGGLIRRFGSWSPQISCLVGLQRS